MNLIARLHHCWCQECGLFVLQADKATHGMLVKAIRSGLRRGGVVDLDMINSEHAW